MESAKQKVSNMASAAKEKIHISKAKAEEKAEKATARTKEEKDIATEVRKVKEAEAKAELHGDKARHAAKKLEAKQLGSHFHLPCTGSVATRSEHHLPGTTTTTGAAGNMAPITSAAPHYQSHPPAYHKHL